MFAIGDKVWPGISKLTEECGEVIQVCGKLMGSRGSVKHWDGTNLRSRLQDELGDLLAAIDFVTAHCELDERGIIERRVKKRDLFNKWHADENPGVGCQP
jgi:NTP pyrophosphatase (non-canonical NTP hydrolase)